jgi:hypothetical protein
MARGRVLSGTANTKAPTPLTAEDCALEYFITRRLSGAFAPRPPIERWRADQRERFEAELQRLEDERLQQLEDARQDLLRRLEAG